MAFLLFILHHEDPPQCCPALVPVLCKRDSCAQPRAQCTSVCTPSHVYSQEASNEILHLGCRSLQSYIREEITEIEQFIHFIIIIIFSIK